MRGCVKLVAVTTRSDFNIAANFMFNTAVSSWEDKCSSYHADCTSSIYSWLLLVPELKP